MTLRTWKLPWQHLSQQERIEILLAIRRQREIAPPTRTQRKSNPKKEADKAKEALRRLLKKHPELVEQLTKGGQG